MFIDTSKRRVVNIDCCRHRWRFDRAMFKIPDALAYDTGILKPDPRRRLTRAISQYSRGRRGTRSRETPLPQDFLPPPPPHPFTSDRGSSDSADFSFSLCSRVYLRDRIHKQMAGPFFLPPGPSFSPRDPPPSRVLLPEIQMEIQNSGYLRGYFTSVGEYGIKRLDFLPRLPASLHVVLSSIGFSASEGVQPRPRT